MAFRFKLDEPLQKALRRMAAEQFAIAESEFGVASVMPGGVHQTRKVLKRLRSLLRLAGPAIGRKAHRTHNAALRDIGRLLSGRREGAVLVETLHKLAAHADDDGARSAIDTLLKDYAAPSRDLAGALDGAVRDEVLTRLAAERKAFSSIRAKGRGFKPLAKGLAASYRKAQTTFAMAYRTADDEAYHELRKMVQAHWRHMSLIAKAWPEALEVRVAAARELSQLLGDDHDLSVLTAHVHADAGHDAVTKEAVERLARTRQADLRRAAKPRIERLLCEPPDAFVDRLSGYWRAARKMPALADVADLSDDGAAPRRDPASSAADTSKSAAKTPKSAPSQERR